MQLLRKYEPYLTANIGQPEYYMYCCWRFGYKLPKIKEYMTKEGFDLSEIQLKKLFKKVVEEYFDRSKSDYRI